MCHPSDVPPFSSTTNVPPTSSRSAMGALCGTTSCCLPTSALWFWCVASLSPHPSVPALSPCPRLLPHPHSPPTRPRCVPQERQSHCRRSDSESPAGTSPEDGQSFKFNSTTVDGQGLQVGSPPQGCGRPCSAGYFNRHPFCLPDQPPAWDTSPAGVCEPQEWREARRAVGCTPAW